MKFQRSNNSSKMTSRTARYVLSIIPTEYFFIVVLYPSYNSLILHLCIYPEFIPHNFHTCSNPPSEGNLPSGILLWLTLGNDFIHTEWQDGGTYSGNFIVISLILRFQFVYSSSPSSFIALFLFNFRSNGSTCKQRTKI